LAVNLNVNGVTGTQTIAPTKSLQANLVIKNTSQTVMSNIVVRLKVAEENNDVPIDWPQVQADGKPTQEGSGLVWSPEGLPALAELASLKELTISVNLPWQKNVKLIGKTYKITATASMNSGTLSIDQSSPEVVITIAENLSLSVEARYYDDDNIAVGSGPFPPQVGKTTTLRVGWSLRTGSGNLSDVRIVAILPPNVSFGSKTSATNGTVTFDENTRAVSWKTDKLPTNLKLVNIYYNVTVKPVAADLGGVLSLTGPATLTARDTSSGSVITKSAQAVTTNLTNDPQFSSSDGVVVNK